MFIPLVHLEKQSLSFSANSTAKTIYRKLIFYFNFPIQEYELQRLTITIMILKISSNDDCFNPNQFKYLLQCN